MSACSTTLDTSAFSALEVLTTTALYKFTYLLTISFHIMLAHIGACVSVCHFLWNNVQGVQNTPDCSIFQTSSHRFA